MQSIVDACAQELMQLTSDVDEAFIACLESTTRSQSTLPMA